MYFAFLTGSELLLVLLAVVILFGATRLPQLGQSLGQGIRNFREAVAGKDQDQPSLDNPPQKKGTDTDKDKKQEEKTS